MKIEFWERYCKKLLVSLLLLIFVMGLSYVYFMNLAVLKTAERNSNSKKLSEVKQEFQNLEKVYIDKIGQLNISYAKSLGFVEAEPSGYVYKQQSVARANNYVENLR